MSFFPPGFDVRADVVARIDLVSIDTPDGPARFLLGGEGRFRDVSGNDWWGCSLISASDLEMSIGGTAPSGSLTLTYQIDTTPTAPTLISQIRALGRDYVAGRAVTFWIQPLLSVEEFHAPTIAPIPVAVREATYVSFEVEGPMRRSISLGIEGPFAGRNVARGYLYNTADHSRLTGAFNVSLEYIPNDLYQRPDERVFG